MALNEIPQGTLTIAEKLANRFEAIEARDNAHGWECIAELCNEYAELLGLPSGGPVGLVSILGLVDVDDAMPWQEAAKRIAEACRRDCLPDMPNAMVPEEDPQGDEEDAV